MHSVTIRITHMFRRSGSHRPAGFPVRAAVFSIALACLLFAATARAQLASVTVTPASVGSPTTASGTVIFGTAVGSATTVTLTSSNPSLVAVPASVVVASGNTSQTFGLTVNSATAASIVTVSATAGPDTVSTDLAVAACSMAQATAPTIPSGDTIWIGDTLPPGSYMTHSYGSAMDWTTDQAADGTSSLYKPYSSSNSLNVSTINDLNERFGIGQSFVAYVLPSSCAPPREIRFSFHTSKGTTTVYWGEGMADDASAIRVGNLPTPGVWTRLEVPLTQLSLEQAALDTLHLSHLDGQVFFDHIGVSGTACLLAPPTPTIPAGDTVFINDTLPAGASITHAWGYAMVWTTDQAADGTKSLYKPYYDSNNTLNVSTINDLNQPLGIGQKFVVYVLPSSCVPPREIRLQFETNKNPVTIYWGEGMADDASAIRIGNVPTPGVWTRLEIPLSQLRLEDGILHGIHLSYLDGQVFFDHIALSGTACLLTPPTPTIPSGDTVLIGDTLPAAASITDAWGYAMVWTTGQAADGTRSLYKPYYDSNNTLNVSTINDLRQPLGIGQNFVVYVLPSSCVPPREIRLQFETNKNPVTIYWGEGMADDASAIRIGNVPTPGVWTRLEIPLSQLLLEDGILHGIHLSYLDGQVFFDHIGLSGTACVVSPTTQTIPSSDTVWIGDALPAGATIGNAWGYGMVWTTDQAADGTRSLYKPYYGSTNILNLSAIDNLNQTLGSGQSFVAYVLPSSCAPPREIRFSLAGQTFYWGGNMADDASFQRIGNLPTPGQWTRLEVPLSQLGISPGTVGRLELSYLDGQVWFDHIGLTAAAPPVLTGLVVTPASATIAPGATQAFIATASYDDHNTANVTATAVWTSSSATVATVSSTGVVSGVAGGIATITATSGALSANASVTVASPVALVSISVTPGSTYRNPGQTVQLTATATYSDDTTRNVTAQAAWTSSAAAVATVSTSGLATAVGQGLASITATLQTLTATSSLVVNPATSCVTLYTKDTALWLFSDGGQPRQVLQDQQGIVMPRLSPSGTRVVYQRASSDDPAIAPLLVIADGTTGTVLKTISPASLGVNALLQLGWRNDHRIYLVGHANPSISLYYELDPESGQFSGEDASERFSVSPDGNFIIRDEFVPHGAPGPIDTSVAELNGIPVYPPSSDTRYHRFALTYEWAPDASRVAFIDTRPLEGTCAIVILRAADGVVLSQTTLPDGIPPAAMAWTMLNQVVFQIARVYYQLDHGGAIVPLASPPVELQQRFVVDVDGEYPAEDQRCRPSTALGTIGTSMSSQRAGERSGISLTTTRRSIPVGQHLTVRISLPRVAGRGGEVLHLSCTAAGIHIPAIVLIPEGNRSTAVDVPTAAGVAGQIVQVTASTESSFGSLVFRLVPTHSGHIKERQHE